jgi:hypothetical protein
VSRGLCGICIGLLALSAPHLVWPASLAGSVQDSANSGSDGVRITIWEPGAGNQFQTISSGGRYSFTGIPSGGYLLKAEKQGMALAYGAVRLSGDEPHELNLILVEKAGGAPAVQSKAPHEMAPESQRLESPAGKVSQSRLLHQVRIPRAALSRGPLRIYEVIRTDGVPDNILILSAADAESAQAVLMVVRQWRYTSTYLDGKAVEVESITDIMPHY